jgi:hypothetical protein
MIDALIKRVSVTYKCYEMYAHRGKKIDQEMDAILLSDAKEMQGRPAGRPVSLTKR